MAKRRRRRKYKKDLLDYVALPNIDLDPDIKKGIFIVFLLAFGAISLLSLFDLSGSMGVYLARGMVFLFGWGKWLFPIILLALGFLLYNEDKYWVGGANYLGLFLFIISSTGLLHLLVEPPSWQVAIKGGFGGGYLGFIIDSGLFKVMGFWASLIILFCLFLISVMLMFNLALRNLIGGESWLAKVLYPINFIIGKLFGSRDEDDEEEEEEFEEEEEEIKEEEEEEVDVGSGFVSHKLPTFFENGNGATKEKVESTWKPSNVKIDLPLDLINGSKGKAMSGDIKAHSEIIRKTLENFGIVVGMGEVSVGPTVTQYTLKPAEGVKVSRITTLSNDLALALAAHPIRIEAPIPGKALVGVEVPNQTKAMVGLKEILSGEQFKKRKSSLMVALGKDVSGKVWMDDLARMPHLLVAGATGSGKSVCLNGIIISLLYQNNPDDLRFIFVDPKRVELPVYNGIPHLLTPVITDVSKTINALKWCLNEMDRRFELLAKTGKRNIDSYNANGSNEKLPYIIFIIDELADLMVVAARDIETGIIRLAQMARAVGIHLILATQRPSVDVITGLIKANMPARIAFSVASGVDSRTILDSLGAEKLLGRGDMLFTTAEISKPKRLQGAFVSDNEIKRIVNYIKEKGGEADYIEGVTDRQKVKGMGGVGIDGAGSDDDELLGEAKEMIINTGKASASYLQRRLSIGYARAARLLDLLEEGGVIGPSNGAKPREVLITPEQYDNMINQGVSGVSLHNSEESEAPDEFLSSDDEEEDEEEETNDDEVLDEDEVLEEDEDVAEEDEEVDEETDDDEEENEEDDEEEKEEETKKAEDDDDGKYFLR